MKNIKVFITILLTCLLLTGCSKNTGEENQIVLTTGFEEGELFSVGDNKCFIPEARIYIKSLESGYKDLYGEGIMKHTVDGIPVPDKLTSIAMSRLAEVKALGMLAKERNVVLSDKDLKKCKDAADRYMDSLSDADIKDLEITPELLLTMYQDYALANKVYDDITRDVNPEISDDEARIITIQRILIKDEDRDKAMSVADSIYSKISEGAGFDSLADDYSEAESDKYSFDKYTDEFSKEFIDACFELSKDEVSAPIITDEGISIVKCLSSYDRERTDANKARLVEKRRAEAFDKVYSDFVHDLYTDFNTGLWDDLQISDRSLDTTENFFDVYEGSP